MGRVRGKVQGLEESYQPSNKMLDPRFNCPFFTHDTKPDNFFRRRGLFSIVMATRILVKCSSETIPGEAIDRRTTIANIACQHRFGRDFDKNNDGLHSAGHYTLNQCQCHFLIDIGPRGSQHPEVYYYRWNGEAL